MGTNLGTFVPKKKIVPKICTQLNMKNVPKIGLYPKCTCTQIVPKEDYLPLKKNEKQ